MAESTGNSTDVSLEDFEPSAPPRQGFGRFLRDVVIILALGGAALYFYQNHVTTREQVEALATQARTKSKKNDLASLNEAEKLFNEALALDSDGRVEAALAEVYVFQNATHGLDTLGKASQHLSAAQAADVQSPSRFAVEAYLKILKDQPEAAERMVKDLLDQDRSAPVLAHALGWSLMEQGDFIEGARIMKSATDADFSAVAYRTTLAEGSHRQGSEKAAIKHLDGIVRPNMNPDHEQARAYLAALRLRSYGNLTTPANIIQDLDKSEKTKSAYTEAFLHWAKAELNIAIGDGKKALEEIAKAKEKRADFPPFVGTEARAHEISGDVDQAIALYEKAIAMKPLYRGLKWNLAKLKSARSDDAALTLAEELEKSKQGIKGPEFEIFRGKHALAKGDLEAAKAHFTQAAELGDDPEILLGLAKVSFEEEIKKGKTADLEKVAEPLQRAMDAKKYFPEAQEFYADVNLWNYLIDGAQGAFEEAEKQMKRLKRPIPEVLAFYDRVVKKYQDVKERKLKKQTTELAQAWADRKKEYIASLLKS